MSDQGTHFYGDGCHPGHKADEACERFTTRYPTSSHHLGYVRCVNCGWYSADHSSPDTAS